MPDDQYSSGLPENATLLRPPQSTRRFMSAFWFMATIAFLWLLLRGSQNHPTLSDVMIAGGFFGGVWLFVTYVIFKQVTMTIEIDGRMFTLRSVFVKPRKLSIDDIESAYCVVGNKGALVLRINLKDPQNKPVSFPLNLFSPTDADRIKAFLGDKYTLSKNKKSS